ncbi:MAG: polysaccharide biosynthesis/export family protein [Gemmatimonadaceae bacterium]
MRSRRLRTCHSPRTPHFAFTALATVVATWLFLSIPIGLGGQATPSTDPRGAYATRAALEQQATDAERAAGDSRLEADARERRRAEAWLLRRRLSEGDLSVGDRIVLRVTGEQAMTDTFTVRLGPELILPALPPIGLRGVLRSELESHLKSQLGRYLQRPEVTAVPLLRVAVMGQVGRPGYYHVPADMLLSDVLMVAGGPATNIDLERSRILREGEALYSARDVRTALADGMSLDALSLRSGDEFIVAQRRQLPWHTLLQTIGFGIGLVTLIVGFVS